jgi:hypothetical protein
MSLTAEIAKIASVDLFKKDAESGSVDTGSLVGRPFHLDYSSALVLVADARKQKAQGIAASERVENGISFSCKKFDKKLCNLALHPCWMRLQCFTTAILMIGVLGRCIGEGEHIGRDRTSIVCQKRSLPDSMLGRPRTGIIPL